MNRPLRVFINPGHDIFMDSGACGHGLREADVVLEVGGLVEKYLIDAGVIVVGNVQDDDLQYVCACANQSDADVFVSIHCNAANTSLARGTETFVCPMATTARNLAICVQHQIVDSLQTLNRGVKEANFYVLTQTKMPAILVELAFITNEYNAELLRTKKDSFARAIARGITDYQLSLGGENE